MATDSLTEQYKKRKAQALEDLSIEIELKEIYGKEKGDEKFIQMKNSQEQFPTISKWDQRFLLLAQHISAWSKDPSTKCGAVITNNNRIISLGFNGLPRGVPDLDNYLLDRELKLQMILHAEVNAILFARRPLEGCTIYTWPFLSCCRCAAVIIQSGITKVVTLLLENELTKRWYKELEVARKLYREAGVEVVEINL